MVSETPRADTPHFLNGEVLAGLQDHLEFQEFAQAFKILHRDEQFFEIFELSRRFRFL